MQRGIKYLTGVLVVQLALYGAGVAAQTQPSQDKAEAGRGVYADDLQRSTKIFTFQQAAPEGPARGREI